MEALDPQEQILWLMQPLILCTVPEKETALSARMFVITSAMIYPLLTCVVQGHFNGITSQMQHNRC